MLILHFMQSDLCFMHFDPWPLLFLPGFIIYFAYGVHHSAESQHAEHVPLTSRLTSRESEDEIFSDNDNDDHDLWDKINLRWCAIL